tara:strand:- start:25955 stop:26827 length:873 start_codon:yes stop_codon:yes gene_type:complete
MENTTREESVQIQNKFFKYEFKTFNEIISSLVITTLIFAVYSGVVPGAALAFSPKLIFVFFSFFFFRVIYKILDRENYDETLNNFLMGALWFWVPLNYIMSDSPYVFTFLLVFLFLKSRNFFMGQSLRLNPFMNILLNSNYAFLLTVYLISIFLMDQRLSLLNDQAILLAFALWLTYLSYKLAKSIRGDKIELEQEYISAQLGPLKSAFIVLITLLIQLALFIFLTKGMLYRFEVLLGLTTLYVFHYFVYHFYLLKTTDREARALSPTTLSYGLASMFIILVASVLENLL